MIEELRDISEEFLLVLQLETLTLSYQGELLQFWRPQHHTEKQHRLLIFP